MLSRRSALKTLAAGAGLPLLGAEVFAEEKMAPIDKAAFQLGVATVTLKSLPLRR